MRSNVEKDFIKFYVDSINKLKFKKLFIFWFFVFFVFLEIDFGNFGKVLNSVNGIVFVNFSVIKFNWSVWK